MKLYLLWMAIAAGLSSMQCCTDSTRGEEEDIQNYITTFNLDARDTLGIKVEFRNIGGTDRPLETSRVEMTYIGKYLDNTIFDKSPADQTVRLKVSNLIPGLQTGVRLFGKGGTGTIIIPSKSGYDDNPPFGVRKNAVLIYEITLIDF